MRTYKLDTLYALRNQSTEWIIGSLKNPNAFMSKTVLTLHKVVLRERGYTIAELKNI